MPRPTLRELATAAYRGDLPYLSAVAKAAGNEWPQLVTSAFDVDRQTTLVHLSLRGHFEAINTPLPTAELRRTLTLHNNTLKLIVTASRGQMARWCPLVDAVHYRLLSAIDLLLRRMRLPELRDCLSEQDVYGQTVLHAAAQAPTPSHVHL